MCEGILSRGRFLLSKDDSPTIEENRILLKDPPASNGSNAILNSQWYSAKGSQDVHSKTCCPKYLRSRAEAVNAACMR